GERCGVEEQPRPRRFSRRPRRHRAEGSRYRLRPGHRADDPGRHRHPLGQDRATIALELRSIADELTTLKDSKDSRGNALFMSGYSLRIPVQSGVQVIAVGTREEVFESVATAGGPKDLAAIVSDAAAALETADPTARAAAVATSVDEVKAAVGHVAAQRGEQGALANRVDALL